MIFGRYFEGLWQLGVLAEASSNLVGEWRGAGLPLGAGMGCVVAFTCPCDRPKIHGDQTSVAYSSTAAEKLKVSGVSGNSLRYLINSN